MDKLLYSKTKIRKAGVTLCNDPTNADALTIAEHWRSLHQAVQNDIHQLLIETSPKNSITVSRLKRMESIIKKLQRPNGGHCLDRMGDIAGCRTILDSIADLYAYQNKLIELFNRKNIEITLKDYITKPKPDGYRSIHLVLKNNYKTNKGFQMLEAEVQIRTRLQNAWATAVETYDAICNRKIKAKKGDREEVLFFACISSLIALREGTPTAQTTPKSKNELIAAIKRIDQQLHIIDVLDAFSQSVSIASDIKKETGEDIELCLIEMDYAIQQGYLSFFQKVDSEFAAVKYSEKERAKTPGKDVLLVQISSNAELRESYASYSSDISIFLNFIHEEIQK